MNFIVHSALKAAEEDPKASDEQQEAARQRAVRVWQFLRDGRPPARGVPLPPPPHVMPYIDAAPSVEQWLGKRILTASGALVAHLVALRRLHDAVAKEGDGFAAPTAAASTRPRAARRCRRCRPSASPA